jgi:glycosyltransferase involved in cell wall biosynthesis
MKTGKIMVTILVPVFNEARSIAPFLNATEAALRGRNLETQFVFIDDGSDDNTFEVLNEISNIQDNISIIRLSRNFGKEAALSAGLEFAKGDVVVPIDVDLQDPPEVITELIEKWREGYDVVLAKRSDRKSDPALKRVSSKYFYKISNLLTTTKIPEDVGDFRLLDRKVVLELRKLKESGRFMKGIFAWVGFRQTTVSYVRASRKEGKSKFNFFRLSKLAIDGVANFSIAPLRASIILGLASALVGTFYGITIISRTLASGSNLPGYPSIMVTILFFGGVQLFSIGIMGEYIGRTFMEAKRRPVFVIEKIVDNQRDLQ